MLTKSIFSCNELRTKCSLVVSNIDLFLLFENELERTISNTDYIGRGEHYCACFDLNVLELLPLHLCLESGFLLIIN